MDLGMVLFEPYVMTIQVASVLARIRQACYYGHLVIGDKTKGFVLFVKEW